MGLFRSAAPLSRQPRVTRVSEGKTFTRLPGGSWSADAKVTRRAWNAERRMERNGSKRNGAR